MSDVTMTAVPNPNKGKRTIPAAAPVAPRPVSARAVEALPVLKESGFKDFAHWQVQFLITLPVGWKFEECLRPEFYAQVSHKLAANTLINTRDLSGALLNIVTEDHNFRAVLEVIAVKEKALQVEVFIPPVYYDLDEIPENEINVAQWNPQLRGWDIVRKSDRAVVADGRNIKTRRAAKEWMERTLRN